MKGIRRLLFRWGLVIVWTAGLFWGSGLLQRPPTPGLSEFKWDDKLQHVVGFAILALLVWMAVGRGVGARRRALWSFGYATIYGIVDECHQLFVPGREGCVSDWLADTAGALMMVVLLTLVGGDGLGRRARTGREDLRGEGQTSGEP